MEKEIFYQYGFLKRKNKLYNRLHINNIVRVGIILFERIELGCAYA